MAATAAMEDDLTETEMDSVEETADLLTHPAEEEY